MNYSRVINFNEPKNPEPKFMQGLNKVQNELYESARKHYADPVYTNPEYQANRYATWGLLPGMAAAYMGNQLLDSSGVIDQPMPLIPVLGMGALLGRFSGDIYGKSLGNDMTRIRQTDEKLRQSAEKQAAKQQEKFSSRSTAHYTIPGALALGAGGVYAAKKWGSWFPADQTADIKPSHMVKTSETIETVKPDGISIDSGGASRIVNTELIKDDSQFGDMTGSVITVQNSVADNAFAPSRPYMKFVIFDRHPELNTVFRHGSFNEDDTATMRSVAGNFMKEHGFKLKGLPSFLDSESKSGVSDIVSEALKDSGILP